MIKQVLVRLIYMLEHPPNALDEVILRLGGRSRVAEMTGRKECVEQNASGGYSVIKRADLGVRETERNLRVPHPPPLDVLEGFPCCPCRGGCAGLLSVHAPCFMEQLPCVLHGVQEKALFMSGKKRVAIISDAASTGISLQDARTLPHSSRRLHITMELPWGGDKAIQQFGRTHRSNQVRLCALCQPHCCARPVCSSTLGAIWSPSFCHTSRATLCRRQHPSMRC